MPRLSAETARTCREPLTPTAKRARLALVIFCHVGNGWALAQVEPAKLIVGDIAPIEVHMVPGDQPASRPCRPTNLRRLPGLSHMAIFVVSTGAPLEYLGVNSTRSGEPPFLR
jgi:hypothetical protein